MSVITSVNRQMMPRVRIQRGYIFGAIIITALFAFEIFNYSTTEYALTDLLGELRFAGVHWATILSIAFCGIDFAGIARLFTPQTDPGRNLISQTDTWYLFGAWMLAAIMNALLTWWGVSLAILGHETLGNAVLSRSVMVRAVPIFVALMVWLIRILIIGTFSTAGNRLITQSNLRLSNPGRASTRPGTAQSSAPSRPPQAIRPAAQAAPAYRPGANRSADPIETGYIKRPEPSYHPLVSKSIPNKAVPIEPGRGKPATRL